MVKKAEIAKDEHTKTNRKKQNFESYLTRRSEMRTVDGGLRLVGVKPDYIPRGGRTVNELVL